MRAIAGASPGSSQGNRFRSGDAAGTSRIGQRFDDPISARFRQNEMSGPIAGLARVLSGAGPASRRGFPFGSAFPGAGRPAPGAPERWRSSPPVSAWRGRPLSLFLTHGATVTIVFPCIPNPHLECSHRNCDNFPCLALPGRSPDFSPLPSLPDRFSALTASTGARIRIPASFTPSIRMKAPSSGTAAGSAPTFGRSRCRTGSSPPTCCGGSPASPASPSHRKATADSGKPTSWPGRSAPPSPSPASGFCS